MKKILACLLVFCLLTVFIPAASAEESVAERLDTTITGSGYSGFGFLSDGSIKTYKTSDGSAEITIESETAMTELYLLFDLEYGAYTILDNNTGKSMTAGEYSFLHEYVKLEAPTTSVTLQFDNGKVKLSEIYAFNTANGEVLPDYVQVWNAPLEGKTDILLMATHGDDDQLFFAGLLPYYAVERDLAVQVVYLTDHRNLTMQRTHEMINGLWSVGVRAYPVFGDFADFLLESRDATYQYYKNLGTSKDDLQSFVVEQLRRFDPQVVVGHDIEGEYGHGMHMVYTDLLINAIDMTNDATVYPESAQKYGTCVLPKVYLHLYAENPVVIDYDQPLDSFDGLTAFQVTQKYGYPCHESQQYTWFTKWINGSAGQITKASQIKTYNPSNFGLYHTTVGEDVAKNDFFENMVSYEEQARVEAERLEQERLEAERLEAEHKEQLEKELAEKERIEAQERQMREILTIAIILGAALLAIVGFVFVKRFRS